MGLLAMQRLYADRFWMLSGVLAELKAFLSRARANQPLPEDFRRSFSDSLATLAKEWPPSRGFPLSTMAVNSFIALLRTGDPGVAVLSEHVRTIEGRIQDDSVLLYCTRLHRKRFNTSNSRIYSGRTCQTGSLPHFSILRRPVGAWLCQGTQHAYFI